VVAHVRQRYRWDTLRNVPRWDSVTFALHPPYYVCITAVVGGGHVSAVSDGAEVTEGDAVAPDLFERAALAFGSPPRPSESPVCGRLARQMSQ
jgi:hypothetical protein